jgi:hypothetical protein
MRKVKFNALINVFTLIFFIASATSGIIVWTILPSRSNVTLGGGKLPQENPEALGQQFLQLSRNNWMDIHTYASLMFIILVVSHDVLHWSWFKRLPKILSRS